MYLNLQKTTSLGLAALYAVVAIFGHALHDHGHSDHGHSDHGHSDHGCSAGGRGTATGKTSRCCHHHCPDGQQQEHSEPFEASDQEVWLAWSSRGDADCVACALIGQLSLGYSAIHSDPIVSLPFLEIEATPYDSPSLILHRTSTSERGPPSLLAA